MAGPNVDIDDWDNIIKPHLENICSDPTEFDFGKTLRPTPPWISLQKIPYDECCDELEKMKRYYKRTEGYHKKGTMGRNNIDMILGDIENMKKENSCN